MHHARFEQESADLKEHGHRVIPHEVAAAPVDAAAIAPLVERAERDAEPSVMLTSDTADAIQPQPACPPIGRSCRFSATPASPINSPPHCTAVTRSPSQRFAMVEVMIGLKPGISADRPAGDVVGEIAIAVPPR